MKCEICKLEINPIDPECGYYEDRMHRTYCEKCYANKRFNEIPKDKQNNWKSDVQGLINTVPTNIAMRKIPTAWESLIDQEKVKKVRNKWKKLNLTTYG